jgi:hypothetical protein
LNPRPSEYDVNDLKNEGLQGRTYHSGVDVGTRGRHAAWAGNTMAPEVNVMKRINIIGMFE